MHASEIDVLLTKYSLQQPERSRHAAKQVNQVCSTRLEPTAVQKRKETELESVVFLSFLGASGGSIHGLGVRDRETPGSALESRLNSTGLSQCFPADNFVQPFNVTLRSNVKHTRVTCKG